MQVDDMNDMLAALKFQADFARQLRADQSRPYADNFF